MVISPSLLVFGVVGWSVLLLVLKHLNKRDPLYTLADFDQARHFFLHHLN